jgi:hypothetical protein
MRIVDSGKLGVESEFGWLVEPVGQQELRRRCLQPPLRQIECPYVEFGK